MISQDALSAAIQQSVAQAMAENAAGGTPEAPKEPEVQKSVALTTEQGLQLQVILLKQHVENLTLELEKRRGRDAQEEINDLKTALQDSLIEMHGVNTETHTISVDAQNYTVLIAPKE